MKNKFLLLLILGVTFFVSCSDDDDKAWKNIPQDEIEIQKVTFEVNGEQATTGTLQMAEKRIRSRVDFKKCDTGLCNNPC